jgi:hypothetical protein
VLPLSKERSHMYDITLQRTPHLLVLGVIDSEVC